MKRILYLNPKLKAGMIPEILRESGDELVATATYVDALEMLRSHSFDVVVIGDEDENADVLNFTVQALRMRPELPVLLEIDWGSDLAIALESIGEFAEFARATHGVPRWVCGFESF